MNKLEIVSTVSHDQRSSVLIASFVDGYAAGWRFAVPEVFRNSLDIKLTPIKIGDKIFSIYTQGKLYSFNSGAVIYDNRIAYETEWGKALKHLKLFLQIVEVKPSEFETFEIIETLINEVEIKIQKITNNNLTDGKKETIKGLIIKKQRRNFGKIIFKLFRPSKNKNKVEELEEIECDQEEFVAFLQTGIIVTNENKQRDLFKEFSL